MKSKLPKGFTDGTYRDAFVKKWEQIVKYGLALIESDKTTVEYIADLDALLEHEREWCARVAEDMVAPLHATSTREHTAAHTTAYKIAVAIRKEKGA